MSRTRGARSKEAKRRGISSGVGCAGEVGFPAATCLNLEPSSTSKKNAPHFPATSRGLTSVGEDEHATCCLSTEPRARQGMAVGGRLKMAGSGGGEGAGRRADPAPAPACCPSPELTDNVNSKRIHPRLEATFFLVLKKTNVDNNPDLSLCFGAAKLAGNYRPTELRPCFVTAK
ncbi:hypothetical protein chiPu_0016489 [Chiloscyllium punctatum]|uniref:Uncharacterized protein n=1 Tax=Chiloscyllium punctatum TaxID=137246 RepID=A0A401T5Q2_CHIPU|nr:hypothetical protein [Chiloscyllium punctatum]